MTIKEYHAHPALSRSRLWLLHESPQKFKWAEEHPEPPSPAFRLGAAFHKLALEPQTFDEEYVVAPTIDRRTKDGKALWEKFTQDSAEMGRELLNAESCVNFSHKALPSFVRRSMVGATTYSSSKV